MMVETLKHTFETPIYQLNMMDCLLLVVAVLLLTVVIEVGGWLYHRTRSTR